jgi:transposase
VTRQGKRCDMVTFREILRTYQSLRSIKATARTLSCAKGTVRRYVRWAQERGLLEGCLPSEADLARAQSTTAALEAPVSSGLEPLGEIIQGWLAEGFTLSRIQELLHERHGWMGSYETLKRRTRPLRENRAAFVRIETAPGEEAQVDFGLMGSLWDPFEKKERKVWLFLMTLSHSRFAYGELVWRQDVETWLACHRRAFEYFGGVPRKMVIDNLKAAILKAALYDSQVHRAYAECAEHYGFVISPCRVATPRHKGKVERGVPYVRQAFWAGRNVQDLSGGNRMLWDWLLNEAGLRIHGTTRQQPRVMWEQVEKKALKTLPEKAFAPIRYQEATVHPDCHVVIEGSYYSVPFRYRGRKMTVRLTDNMVDLFEGVELVASHTRMTRKGRRSTVLAHYPPEKAAYLEHTPQWCLAESGKVGPATHELIREILLAKHPMDGLRKAQGILRMRTKYLPERMEAASRRSLKYENFTYQSYKTLLERGLDQVPALEEAKAVGEMTYRYARPVGDFLHVLES